jgi:hypothetical protein
MGQKIPTAKPVRAQARRPERDRRERRAFQRNVGPLPALNAEPGTVLRFPGEKPPSRAGRRTKS